MRLSLWRVLRVLFFYICPVLVLMVLNGFLISCLYGMVKNVENYENPNSNNFKSLLQSEINKRTHLFNATSSSATNLARLLGSSLNGLSKLSLSEVENKVAPFLFQALLTIPHLTQISFIGSQGLRFTYYKDKNQTFALYSNYSPSGDNSTSSSTKNAWYTQPADRDTGKLLGDAVRLANPSNVTANHESWFQQALNSSNGFNFLGTKWNSAQDLMFINTASVNNGKGLISLGFLVKEIVEYYNNVADLQGGSFYLVTKDGKILAEGIKDTRMVISPDSSLISFELMKSNGEKVGPIGSVSCNPNNVTSSSSPGGSPLEIQGTNYMFYCSPLDIMGVQSVYVLAVPQNGLISIMHKSSRAAVILIIFIIITMFISILIAVYEISKDALIKMCLRAQLIKQMEATQQAERKSMNKSRAFASASHDIRASLAGLIGWIRFSYNEVDHDSNLRTNLRQMEACSEDLLGILNSILDTSRIEEGKIQLKEEEFNMVQLLQDVVDLYRPMGAEKGIDVVLNICDEDSNFLGLSHVKGDREKLKQIFCNLLSNAIKFTSEGHVIVRARVRKPSLDMENAIVASNKSRRRLLHMFYKEKNSKEDQSLEVQNMVMIKNDPNSVEFVFEVDDTGKGIPKEKQKAIFDNYVQVEETAMEHGGTGLGLGIVQSLVRLMHGEIEVVDKDMGENGSCFRFNVILSVCEDKGHQVNLHIGTHGSGSSLKKDGITISNSRIGRVSTGPSSSRNDNQYMTKVKSEIQLEAIDSSSGEISPWKKKKIQSPTSSYRSSSNYIKSKSPIHSRNYHQLRHDLVVEQERGESSGGKFLSGKKILVVDDNLIQRVLTVKQISILGSSVDVCTNGKEAVELVCKGLANQRKEKEKGFKMNLPYDYILMDCEMSIMSGYEATKEIRRLEESYGVRIPIIGLSAHPPDSEEANKTIMAGLDAFLSKPLVPELLLEAIEDIHKA